jgi:hypothetical protein
VTCNRDCIGYDHDCRDTVEFHLDVGGILDEAELAGLLPTDWAACYDARRKWSELIRKAVERAS